MTSPFSEAADQSLAARLGTTPAAAAQALPAAVGQGYLRTEHLGPPLQLTTYHVVLRRALAWQRPAQAAAAAPTLFFSLRYLPAPAGSGALVTAAPAARLLPVLQVATAGLDFGVQLPAQQPLTGLLLVVDAAWLAALLDELPAGSVLPALVAGQHQALYEAFVTPAMLAVAAQLLTPAGPAALRRYYLRAKAEELLYLLLEALLQRAPAAAAPPVRPAEVRQLYAARDHLVADLSAAPLLATLARESGLSASRLQRLFKQVFGQPVYGYFQTVRLREAARLLGEERRSVTEVAYQLGFRNRSHFSRLFARHFGQKPKQYGHSR